MEHFQVDLPLQLRAAAGEDSDGRTLEGRIVPYDTEIQVGETMESFAKGVFADTDPASVVLLWQHDVNQPIGRMSALTEEADGAYGTFRLADTERAREARSLAADGILTGLSVLVSPVSKPGRGKVPAPIRKPGSWKRAWSRSPPTPKPGCWLYDRRKEWKSP